MSGCKYGTVLSIPSRNHYMVQFDGETTARLVSSKMVRIPAPQVEFDATSLLNSSPVGNSSPPSGTFHISFGPDLVEANIYSSSATSGSSSGAQQVRTDGAVATVDLPDGEDTDENGQKNKRRRSEKINFGDHVKISMDRRIICRLCPSGPERKHETKRKCFQCNLEMCRHCFEKHLEWDKLPDKFRSPFFPLNYRRSFVFDFRNIRLFFRINLFLKLYSFRAPTEPSSSSSNAPPHPGFFSPLQT